MPKRTEAELIAVAATLKTVGECERLAERAKTAGMDALVVACEERAKGLKSIKTSGGRNAALQRGHARKPPLKTHVVAEQALAMLIKDYRAELPPTTYGALAERCGYGGQNNARWFGQVTDLIDAACALAGVPSFALVRVRESNGDVNAEAWLGSQYSHLRERILASALAGKWSDDDFAKMRDAIAVFSAHGFGNKKAWDYVWGQISMEDWAG
jgi:hypothetical protein